MGGYYANSLHAIPIHHFQNAASCPDDEVAKPLNNELVELALLNPLLSRQRIDV